MPSIQYFPGDIIGFMGSGWRSQLICIGTGGVPYRPFHGISHVGIIGQYKRKTYLFETTTLCDLPCAIRGVRFEGTQAHPLEERLASYKGRAWHYPLLTPLWANETKRLNAYLLEHIGHDYDRTSALFAADLLPSCIETWLHPDARDSFCSLWCVSAHATIGRFKTDDLNRWSPNRLIRAERKQGILLPAKRIL